MARYKVLQSVAHSIGHSFTSLTNYDEGDYILGHLLRRARQTSRDTLRVNLMNGEASPEVLLVPPVQRSIKAYAAQLPELVARHESDMRFVRDAHMTVSFTLQTERPSRILGEMENPYRCTVEVVDDRGKSWEATHADWMFPEPDGPEWSESTPPKKVRKLPRGFRALQRFFGGGSTTS